VRAYGQAAREVLKSAPRHEVSMKATIHLEIPLAVIGKVHPVIGQYGGVRREEEYKSDGTAVVMTVEVEATVAGGFKEALANATSGQITVQQH
jgi:putative IMPACT (imprinted ancient) family translation regulator